MIVSKTHCSSSKTLWRDISKPLLNQYKQLICYCKFLVWHNNPLAVFRQIMAERVKGTFQSISPRLLPGSNLAPRKSAPRGALLPGGELSWYELQISFNLKHFCRGNFKFSKKCKEFFFLKTGNLAGKFFSHFLSKFHPIEVFLQKRSMNFYRFQQITG